MVICYETLPASYLLALATAAAPATAGTDLAAHLARACRSGKPAVWVDCRLLDTLSATEAWLLWSCQQRLARRGARLVLCQVPAGVAQLLRRTLANAGESLLLAPTLDDAAALA